MRFHRFLEELTGLDRPESGGDRIAVRVLELVMLVQVLQHAWEWAFYLPRLDEIVHPAGIAFYLDLSFLFDPFAAKVNALLISIFMLTGFARAGRFSYLAALLLMHLQYAARFSQGAIGHGSNLTGMVLLSFAVALLLSRDERVRRGVAFGFSLFFAGLGYVSAAMSKIIGSGLLWADGRHLYLWMGERSVDRLSRFGEFEFNLLQQMAFDHYWLATSLLLFGLLAELSGFLLWFRKTRPLQATLLIGMHVGILLVMNIRFSPYMVLLLVMGYPWGRLLDRLKSHLSSIRSDSS